MYAVGIGVKTDFNHQHLDAPFGVFKFPFEPSPEDAVDALQVLTDYCFVVCQKKLQSASGVDDRGAKIQDVEHRVSGFFRLLLVFK